MINLGREKRKKEIKSRALCVFPLVMRSVVVGSYLTRLSSALLSLSCLLHLLCQFDSTLQETPGSWPGVIDESDISRANHNDCHTHLSDITLVDNLVPTPLFTLQSPHRKQSTHNKRLFICLCQPLNVYIWSQIYKYIWTTFPVDQRRFIHFYESKPWLEIFS